MNIALVYGGNGSESEVSGLSKDGISAAIKTLGHNVFEVNFSQNIILDLQRIKPDIVFNGMHGKWGEDGALPLILNCMQIPYTHAGYESSKLGISKHEILILANSLGIKTSPFKIYTEKQILNDDYTIVEKSAIKPCRQGSSRGVFIVNAGEKIAKIEQNIKEITSCNDTLWMVQKFFLGTSVDVAVFDGKAIGGVEIVPQSEFYDMNAKYYSDDTEYVMPPRISDSIYEQIKNAALLMHNEINAGVVSRSDFIVSGDEYSFLEINTHPGMTSHSLVPKIAGKIGISYEDIVSKLIATAGFSAM